MTVNDWINKLTKMTEKDSQVGEMNFDLLVEGWNLEGIDPKEGWRLDPLGEELVLEFDQSEVLVMEIEDE